MLGFILYSKISMMLTQKGFQKYFYNTVWLLLDKVLRMVIGLILGVLVVRYLGPERYGVLSYAKSFVAIFSSLACLGLNHIVVRELVQTKNFKNEIVGTALGLYFCGAILSLGLGMLICLMLSESFQSNLVVFVVSISIIFQPVAVFDWYYQSEVKSRYVVLASAFSFVISSVVKMTLLLLYGSVLAFAWVMVLESVLYAGGLLYFYLKSPLKGNFHTLCFRVSTARKLLIDSWPLMLSGLFVSIYMKIDQVMVNSLLGSVYVGQYAAAVQISEVWYFIPVAICSSVFPAIINAKQSNRGLYYSRLSSLYTLMVVVSIVVFMPITFFSHQFVSFLYGADYAEAGKVLIIHAWSGLFVFLGVASGRWLLAENLQIYLAINGGIGAAINVALNFWLIPTFGIVGCAWATFVSYGIASYLGLSLWSKTRVNFYMVSKSLFFARFIYLFLVRSKEFIR